LNFLPSGFTAGTLALPFARRKDAAELVVPILCDHKTTEAASGLIGRYPHLKLRDAMNCASTLSPPIAALRAHDDDLVKPSGLIGNPPHKISEAESDLTFETQNDAGRLL